MTSGPTNHLDRMYDLPRFGCSFAVHDVHDESPDLFLASLTDRSSKQLSASVPNATGGIGARRDRLRGRGT